ncbi:MAG: Major cardiolipin synthase ClsA [Lentisphaerae bacterium ADurb.BinA184]|nr:MAG: Major cardiolipin synthase ClsA [Lentisphaerae bacterium ADurb.BinA184]
MPQPALNLGLFAVAGLGVWLPLGLAVHVLLALAVAVHCLCRRREATSSLLWITVAWSLPVFGALLYVCIGINQMPAKVWRKQRADPVLGESRRGLAAADSPALVYWKAVHGRPAPEPDNPTARDIESALSGLVPDYPLLGGNNVQLLITGEEAYPPMLAAIAAARRHIHLQSFIIARDAVGRQFLDALAERARAGVQVRVLYDRFGSTHAVLTGLFRRYRRIPNLRLVGWTQANPVKRQFQINLRNHRKVLIVDGALAFTGGLNLTRVNLAGPEGAAVRDYHFRVRGPAVQELQYTFLRDWHYMTNEPAEALLNTDHLPDVATAGPALVRVINGGPTTAESDVIGEAIFAAIVSARQQVIAVTPYFVPTRDLIQALRSAARRGVTVKLVVPRYNNHVYAGLAGRALYEDLLEAGARVFERERPFLHAKVLLIDNVLAIVGTANLDARSLRLNYETNLAVHDQRLVYGLHNAVAEELSHSAEINLRAWRRRPLRQKLLENFCGLLTPAL